MDLGLSQAVVLLTGGSKGIGLACAHAFAAEGARVAIAARRPEGLRAAQESLERAGYSALALSADLTQAREADALVAKVVSQLGPIDILVNNAGAARRTPPAELQASDWHDAMDAKFFTYLHAMQSVLPAMAARGKGVIVNVIGNGGKIASPTHLPGGAANAALMLASTGLANAFAAKGVRINAINPGLVATERLLEGFRAQARMTGESLDTMLESAIARAPMGRLAQADDIAKVVLFMASSMAAYVNGALLSVDGATTSVIL